MIDQVTHLKKMAVKMVADQWGRRDGRYLYHQMNPSAEGLPTIDPSKFENEWVCARLAIGCISWEQACLENKISDESARKAFLRSVMELFKSEESRPAAESFSEYLHSNDQGDSGLEILAMATCFFKRLNWPVSMERATSATEISESFRSLVFALEAAKSEMHKHFEEQRGTFF
jgi:hypothetical protein